MFLRIENKKGLPLVAGALFAVLLMAVPAGAGFAQNNYGGYNGGGTTTSLNDRLNQIETQIQTLSSTVYRGGPPPTASSGGAPMPTGAAAADIETRLSAIEDQLKSLTGQVEQANHAAQDAQDRLNKLQADYDARLGALEHGGAAPAAHADASSFYNAQANASAGASTPDIPKTLGTLSSAGADSADALYESAFADVRDAHYDAAEGKLKQFLAKYPSHALAGNAGYWLAETYYVRADYKQAAKAFAQNYQDYPKGPKAADSLLKLGKALAKMGKKDDACLSLLQLKKDFPSNAVPANRAAVQEMKQIGCS
jgi:tol-pal system protein YbgF